MAEEKIRTNTKKISKWLGAGFYALFLAILIYYQIPWKVIVFFILLFGCGLVPKRHQRKVKFTFVAILAVLVIWIFLPDDNSDWRPYSFDKEIHALEAKYSIPDKDNAAKQYVELFQEEAFGKYDPNLFWGETRDQILYSPWLSKDRPEVADWLKDMKYPIDRLVEISKLELCRFPVTSVHYDPNLAPPNSFKDVTDFWFSVGSSRYTRMREASYLLTCSANNDIAEGRIEAAFEKFAAVFKLAKHVSQNINEVDKLMSMGFEGLAMKALNSFMISGECQDDHLDTIESLISQISHDWQVDFPEIMEFEKLRFKSFICGSHYQTNSKGKTRLNHDPASRLSGPRIDPNEYGLRKETKATLILCWFFVPSSPRKTSRVIDEYFEREVHPLALPGQNWKEKPKYSLRRLLGRGINFNTYIFVMERIHNSDYYHLHDLYLRAHSWQRVCLIIIKLRRYKNEHGSWPENLADIKNLAPEENFIDPLNGGEFVYRLTDENFILYSKGVNGRDDGGSYKTDDQLFWPFELEEDKNERMKPFGNTRKKVKAKTEKEVLK